ncbi:hypothetical protein IFO70_33770 [Phormidium tenue FACHB-886]|nr:hypothetical protein [Phormidium tenue FACHB-886]
MLGEVHNGVAFPLLWWMLDKKGNSNTEEQIDLLEEFFQVFPEVEVEYLPLMPLPVRSRTLGT